MKRHRSFYLVKQLHISLYIGIIWTKNVLNFYVVLFTGIKNVIRALIKIKGISNKNTIVFQVHLRLTCNECFVLDTHYAEPTM